MNKCEICDENREIKDNISPFIIIMAGKYHLGIPVFDTNSIEDEAINAAMATIKYCPRCGRKLGEDNE